MTTTIEHGIFGSVVRYKLYHIMFLRVVLSGYIEIRATEVKF